MTSANAEASSNAEVVAAGTAVTAKPTDGPGHPQDCRCPLCDPFATLLGDDRREEFDTGLQS